MSTETLLVVVVAVAVAATAVAALVWVVARRGRTTELPVGLDASWAEKGLLIQTGIDELKTHLARFQESVAGRDAALNQQVQGMSQQVRHVSDLFTNDRARGGWGEISMLRIFELGGLVEGRDFTAQFNAGDRQPDAVVHLPGGRDIVIDSKFPVARYNDALKAENPDERQRLLVDQGKELERVGRQLIEKDYADLASGGYVVVYLPSQAVYEAALEADPELLERLMRRRVILAGPPTLFALLMHVASVVTEHRAIQQSTEILEAAKQLHGRMSTFVGHLQKVGNSLAKTVTAFNQTVGSWTDRVSPQLNRVSELSGQVTLEGPAHIDETVREVQVPAHTRLPDPSFN